jgi:hypothetical protein
MMRRIFLTEKRRQQLLKVVGSVGVHIPRHPDPMGAVERIGRWLGPLEMLSDVASQSPPEPTSAPERIGQWLRQGTPFPVGPQSSGTLQDEFLFDVLGVPRAWRMARLQAPERLEEFLIHLGRRLLEQLHHAPVPSVASMAMWQGPDAWVEYVRQVMRIELTPDEIKEDVEEMRDEMEMDMSDDGDDEAV